MAGELPGVNTPVYGATMNDRLTKDDWITHGLRTLANDGPNALKAGPIAASQKVSRASFPWHLRNIAHFRCMLVRSLLHTPTVRVSRSDSAPPRHPGARRHL